MCGIGGSGRLGPSAHIQHGFQQVTLLHTRIIRVATGQDHTLALCDNGDVLTWGLNRFYQLGYLVETAKPTDEPIQITPKKVHGPIKKELVIGVAGSKKASACWTASCLFTWGTNTGNLGYESGSQGFQVLPRRVSSIAEPVLDVAISVSHYLSRRIGVHVCYKENAMICLLQSRDIFCFSGDTHFKINFNSSRPYDSIFLTTPRIEITKVVTNDALFACLSRSGDVYTFPAPTPSGTTRSPTPIKPQLVWALRRKLTAVMDIALGEEGSLILCTRSGHVYLRSRSSKILSGKSFKFQQVPYLHRAFRVFANPSGSYGALCLTGPPPSLTIPELSLAEDLRRMQPWFSDQAIEEEII